MRNFFFRLLLLCLCATFTVSTVRAQVLQHVDFKKELNYESALELAAKESKLLFIDFYTTWCVPCKTMDAEVFTNAEVAAFMNDKFVNVKFDAEAGESVSLARQFKVRAFPTFVVVDSKGVEVLRLEGASRAALFLEKLQKGLDQERSPESLEARFEAGERTPSLVNDYVLSILETGDEAKGFSIISNYFNSLSRKEKASKDHAFLYDRYGMNLGDEKVKYLFANKKAFVKSHGADWVNKLMHRYLRAELIPYANGYHLRQGNFSPSKFEALMKSIKSAKLPDSMSFDSLIELAEVRNTNVPVGMPFLDAFERIAPKLELRDANLLLYSFSDFVGHEDTAVRARAVKLIEQRLDGISSSTVGMIRRIVADLEVKDDTEGVHFRDLTFNEALALAKRQQKLVFIDAYTEWCGPCNMMDQQVFPRKEVGEFMNTNFINLKIDMEKGEGVELAKRFNIRAYPTFFLINSDGEVVHKITGFQEPMPFIRSLRKGMNVEFSLMSLEKRYESGERMPELLKAYVQVLAESSEIRKINAVLNDYFNGLSEDQRFEAQHSFCYEHAPNMKEIRFAYFLQHAEKIRGTLGVARFEEILDQVCAPILMNYQANWKNPNLIEQEFKVLDTLDLPEQTETGAILGLIRQIPSGDFDRIIAYLDGNIHRFEDKNQLFAMYQLLGVPLKGTDGQRLALQTLLKRVILNNNNDMTRTSLTQFLTRLEDSIKQSEK